MKTLCGGTGDLIEGHNRDECVPCLQAMLAWWKSAVGENYVEQIKTLGYRVASQRKELARLNVESNGLWDAIAKRPAGSVGPVYCRLCGESFEAGINIRSVARHSDQCPLAVATLPSSTDTEPKR